MPAASDRRVHPDWRLIGQLDQCVVTAFFLKSAEMGRKRMLPKFLVSFQGAVYGRGGVDGKCADVA